MTIKIPASYRAFSDTTPVGKWVAQYSWAKVEEVQAPHLGFTGIGGVVPRLVGVEKLWSKHFLSC